MTYPLLSAAFLAIAVAVLLAGLRRAPDRAQLLRRWRVPAIVTGVALVVLTVVFDNAMIAAGLMTYAAGAISGLRLGLVPIEDLAYPIAGLMLLPGLWLLLRGRPRRPTATGADSRWVSTSRRHPERSSR